MDLLVIKRTEEKRMQYSEHHLWRLESMSMHGLSSVCSQRDYRFEQPKSALCIGGGSSN